MALGDPYITPEELQKYLGGTRADKDDLLGDACQSGSDWVNELCGRDFNQETVATARVYEARSWSRLDVDDFYTTTGLVIAVDTADSGTYGTTWPATAYTLKPFNGIEAGIPGFPYRQIVAVASNSFPCQTGRARVQVTAKWGWAAVPTKVKQAAKILAAEVYRLKDAPLGVVAASDFGPLSVRENKQAGLLLRNYMHPSRTGPLVG